MVLLIPAGIWAGSHIVLWALCFSIAIGGALSLICSLVMLVSQKKLFVWLALHGACSTLILGASAFFEIMAEQSHKSDGSKFSLLLAAIYFLVTITAPLFVVALCFFELRRKTRVN